MTNVGVEGFIEAGRVRMMMTIHVCACPNEYIATNAPRPPELDDESEFDLFLCVPRRPGTDPDRFVEFDDPYADSDEPSVHCSARPPFRPPLGPPFT